MGPQHLNPNSGQELGSRLHKAICMETHVKAFGASLWQGAWLPRYPQAYHVAPAALLPWAMSRCCLSALYSQERHLRRFSLGPVGWVDQRWMPSRISVQPSPWHVAHLEITLGFLGGTSDKEPLCKCRSDKICRLNPWVRKIPWKRVWQPTPVFLAGESPWTEETGGLSP